MTNQEIYDLIACFERSSLQSMKLSQQDFSIELSRAVAAAAPVTAAAPVMAAAPAAPAAAPAPADDGNTITAPLVGTFYAAPSPQAAPFVKAGDTVKKNDTVCILEAMKMMSEVPAPCDCVIEAVLKADGELAAFGEALLRIKPC